MNDRPAWSLALGDLVFDEYVIVPRRTLLPCTCCNPPAMMDTATGRIYDPRAPLGPNAGRPEHGAANLADARAYHERLAARGERDES
jgi:hypothetical protein